MDIKENIKQIIAAEADAMLSIDINQTYEDVVQALFRCEGKVITTGIGKAGHIAKKFAATLCSTATPSAFIHPSESAHGDLGLLQPKDYIIAFSNSGQSDEVIQMLHLAKHLDIACIIGITSKPDSPLEALSNYTLHMGKIIEPCPIKLTPSASVACMLAISDGIALTLMELKGITTHDFSIRHHAGYLGKLSKKST